MLRDGPRKARKTTKQHAAGKETEKRLAKVLQGQKNIRATKIRFAQQNATAEAANAEMRADLEARERELAAGEAKLAAEKKALSAQAEALICKAKLHEARGRAREEAIEAKAQDLQNDFGDLKAIMTGLEDGSVTVTDNKIDGRGVGAIFGTVLHGCAADSRAFMVRTLRQLHHQVVECPRNPRRA